MTEAEWKANERENGTRQKRSGGAEHVGLEGERKEKGFKLNLSNATRKTVVEPAVLR